MGRLEESIIIRQFAHLTRRDIGKLLTAIPDIDAPQTRHRIKNFHTFGIDERYAFGPHNDARPFFSKLSLRGEGMNVMRRIQSLSSAVGMWLVIIFMGVPLCNE